MPNAAAFIHTLDIGPAPAQFSALEGSEPIEPSAAVVAGTIVAFAPGVSEQHRSDVERSLLLAQLAANAKADRQMEPAAWFRAYRAVLEQVAWVVEASSAAARYLAPVASFTISTVICDTFRAKLTPEQLNLVTVALNAFRSDRNGGAQVAFECPSHSGGLGNFQVALAAEEEGTVNVRLAQISFSAPQHVIRLMQEEFTSSAQFRVGFLALSINEQVFATLRPAITSKLGDRLQGAVVRLLLS